MAKSKKIVIAVVTLILAVVVIYFSRWLIRYYFYNDYQESLSSYEYEEGSAFEALEDSGKEVAGMKLVAENDTLKLQRLRLWIREMGKLPTPIHRMQTTMQSLVLLIKII